MRYRIAAPALVAVAALALVGCNSTAGGSAAATTEASAAAPASVEPTEAAPSEAAASEAAPSEAAPSDAIPSFAFPSDDKELEALLPNELCGAKVIKFSFSGDTFAEDADPEFAAMLQSLGKSTDDVSLAVAGVATADDPCSAGIFRIKGADPNKLKEVFLAETAKEGTTFEEKSIGGRTVLYDKDSDSFQYAYFKDDAVIFFVASDDQRAAEILAALP